VQIDHEDLLNATEVAALLGLAHREAVATYRRRYDTFPEPIIKKGTCVLWHRPDIEAWARSTGRPVSPRP
jgi:predicted DNA-binding transcriptional regulator AlpA